MLRDEFRFAETARREFDAFDPMRAFDFASRVARLFATRRAVLQNANIRKFAPKGRRRRGEELTLDVVNEDVFLRNARLVDQLTNDGQDYLRGRVAKVVLFARSAVVQVDVDRDDFALWAPAFEFEFSGRLIETTEDFGPSVGVGRRARPFLRIYRGRRIRRTAVEFFIFLRLPGRRAASG